MGAIPGRRLSGRRDDRLAVHSSGPLGRRGNREAGSRRPRGSTVGRPARPGRGNRSIPSRSRLEVFDVCTLVDPRSRAGRDPIARSDRSIHAQTTARDGPRGRATRTRSGPLPYVRGIVRGRHRTTADSRDAVDRESPSRDLQSPWRATRDGQSVPSLRRNLRSDSTRAIPFERAVHSRPAQSRNREAPWGEHHYRLGKMAAIASETPATD